VTTRIFLAPKLVLSNGQNRGRGVPTGSVTTSARPFAHRLQSSGPRLYVEASATFEAVGVELARWAARVGSLSLTTSVFVLGLVSVGVGAATAPQLLAVRDLTPGFSQAGGVTVSTTVSGSVVDPASCGVRERLDHAAFDAYTVRFTRSNASGSNFLTETVGEYRDVVSARTAFAALADESRGLEHCRPATLEGQAAPSAFESALMRFPRIGDQSFAARIRFVSTAQEVLDVTFRSGTRGVVMAFPETGANVVSSRDEVRIAKRAASLLAKSH
jgi:hypothetical protein